MRAASPSSPTVMPVPGLDPGISTGIHEFFRCAERQDVDGRVTPGHDEGKGGAPTPTVMRGRDPRIHEFFGTNGEGQKNVDPRIKSEGDKKQSLVKPGGDKKRETPRIFNFHTNSFEGKSAKDVMLHRFNHRGDHPHPRAWPNNRRPTMAEPPRKPLGPRAARAHRSERNTPWLTP